MLYPKGREKRRGRREFPFLALHVHGCISGNFFFNFLEVEITLLCIFLLLIFIYILMFKLITTVRSLSKSTLLPILSHLALKL